MGSSHFILPRLQNLSICGISCPNTIPTHIHTFEHSTQPLCWRDCGMLGNLFHLLLTCKTFAIFWKATAQLISYVTNTFILPSPELALLKIRIDDYHLNLHCTIVHILLPARLALVRHWRFPDHILLNVCYISRPHAACK